MYTLFTSIWFLSHFIHTHTHTHLHRQGANCCCIPFSFYVCLFVCLCVMKCHYPHFTVSPFLLLSPLSALSLHACLNSPSFAVLCVLPVPLSSALLSHWLCEFNWHHCSISISFILSLFIPSLLCQFIMYINYLLPIFFFRFFCTNTHWKTLRKAGCHKITPRHLRGDSSFCLSLSSLWYFFIFSYWECCATNKISQNVKYGDDPAV